MGGYDKPRSAGKHRVGRRRSARVCLFQRQNLSVVWDKKRPMKIPRPLPGVEPLPGGAVGILGVAENQSFYPQRLGVPTGLRNTAVK